MYIRYIKRILDSILALLGIIILLPVILLIAVAIKIDSKGPIFFKQKRVGINTTYFMIYKFRTMKIDTPDDMPTHMLNNPDAYITRVGKILRKTSLDELPQMINILKGDMAVIGPRPALWNQYDLVEERSKYSGDYGLTVNEVRPGLTGWAQINGRDELEIKDKARLDGEYVNKMSFIFDIKCFFYTIVSVLHHKGVVEGSSDEAKSDREKVTQ